MFLTILGAVVGTVGAAFLGLKYFCPWIRYDIYHIICIRRFIKTFMKAVNAGLHFIDIFEKQVQSRPDKALLIFHDDVYTYKYVDQQANKAARAFIEIGLKQGDVVCLFSFNAPAFVWTALALQKIGVQTAFLNYNVRSRSLLHCIRASEPKLLIVGQGSELFEAVEEIQTEIVDIAVYAQGVGSRSLPEAFRNFDKIMDRMSHETIDRSLRSDVKLTDPCVFIFTSGTTGLPKPAITHVLKNTGSTSFWLTFGMTEDDIVYEPLPLYHSAGWLLGFVNTVGQGATMVLRPKFSASCFWEDCRKHKVTIIHYIGELCRYLVARPETDLDGVHNIKYAFGNGLRPDVWKVFQERFKIPQIVEFYAATEGLDVFVNLHNKFGAVGRSSPFLRRFNPTAFVKFDTELQEPVRDEHGRLIEVGPGEVGLLLSSPTGGKIYAGYKGKKEASERRLMHNVFKDGDTYFNSGDLFYIDNDYFVYFSDRTGDTYRWKGENVSTIEVSNVLVDLDFISDATVYGVMIPGCEGRAGMTTITLKNPEESLTENQLRRIANICNDMLPAYARPRFMRLRKELDLTSTYKQIKGTLVEDGFDIEKIKDPIYYYDTRKQMYFPLDKSSRASIIANNIPM